MKEFKFNVGDIVTHKGYSNGEGKGGRFIVADQLQDDDHGLNYDYKLIFLPMLGCSEMWDEYAKNNKEAREWEDKLELDKAYHRDQILDKLGI
jgi:hypothetical protein